jgi:dTDP-glucose 4,6-dehydratase
MSKIIVTGGLGFIGSHFVNYVNKSTDHEVLIVDKMTYAASRKNIKHPTPILEKDICDVTAEDLGDYDYIVHFAAESHVDNSIKDGLPFVRTNVEGTYNLIEVARKNPKLKKFLHISTDEVYGDMSDHTDINHTATESEELNPSSYYSATKTAADLLVAAAGRTFNFPYLITRTCNNYGENQHQEKFIPKVIHSIKSNVKVPVYGDGTQVREWIHADDNAAAIYKLLLSDKIQEIFNIGVGERYQNIEILNLIGTHLGKTVDFEYVEDRLGHDKKYALNCRKFEQEFGSIQTIQFADWLIKNV